jgi:hypothetical protein
MNARRLAAGLVAGVVVLGACGRGDKNLWDMRFPDGQDRGAITRTEVTGYWEGDVSMGGIRLRIEPATVTLALRCDGEGRKQSQASAPIVVADAPARMVLQQDLAGGDKDCGFRFNKGDALTYALGDDGLLEVAFGGASVARLAKRADLATIK